MPNLTLKHFRYFEALARHGHFGRAAETCAISQPALSMQIREMEGALGSPLFERGTRAARLTDIGIALAPRIRDILRSVDELGDHARAATDRFSGRLRIGVIPTVAPYLLPAIIGDLTRLNAELDIHVRETLTPRLLAELAAGRIDTAIVALPVSEPSLIEVALFSEEFVLVRPAADAGRPVPNRDMLREMRLLLLEEGHCFREQALSFCRMTAAQPREIMDGSALSTLVQMVGAGIGVTLIPEMAVAVETRSAPVSVARFAHPRPARTVGMVWRRTSPLGPRLRQLSDIVWATADQLRGARTDTTSATGFDAGSARASLNE